MRGFLVCATALLALGSRAEAAQTGSAQPAPGPIAGSAAGVQAAQAASPVLITADTSDALKGIAAIYVVVAPVDPILPEFGLTAGRIRSDTQLLLRRWHIPFVGRRSGEAALALALAANSEKLRKPRPLPAQLYVNVDTVANTDGSMIAYDVHVEVREPGRLLRSPSHTLLGLCVWHKGGIGLAGKRRIAESVEAAVTDGVQQFCDDFTRALHTPAK